MKNAHATILSAALFLLAACREDDVRPGITTYPNYTQLKKGNYWIYELYNVDSLGNGSSTNTFDSAYISRDSIINGNTYYYLEGSFPSNINNKWLRDSLHYLADLNGRICFSSMDFVTTFYEYPVTLQPGDTMAIISEQMAEKDRIYTVPAGTFRTSAYRYEFHIRPPYDEAGSHRFLYCRYAENIGLVSEIRPFFSSQPNYTERRLVRYHLN